MAKLSEVLDALNKLELQTNEDIRLLNSSLKNKPEERVSKFKTLSEHAQKEIAKQLDVMQSSKHYKTKDDDPRLQKIREKIEHIQLMVLNNSSVLNERIDIVDSFEQSTEVDGTTTSADVLTGTSVVMDEEVIISEVLKSDELKANKEHMLDILVALTQLKKQWPQDVQKKLNDLMDCVTLLSKKNDEEIKLLHEVLKKTHELMNRSLSDLQYKRFANSISEKLSPALKVLGGLMIALSLAVLAVGIAFSSTISGALIATSALSVGAGIAFSLSSLGLFSVKQNTEYPSDEVLNKTRLSQEIKASL